MLKTKMPFKPPITRSSKKRRELKIRDNSDDKKEKRRMRKMGRTKRRSTTRKNQSSKILLYGMKEALLKVTMIIFKRKQDQKEMERNNNYIDIEDGEIKVEETTNTCDIVQESSNIQIYDKQRPSTVNSNTRKTKKHDNTPDNIKGQSKKKQQKQKQKQKNLYMVQLIVQDDERQLITAAHGEYSEASSSVPMETKAIPGLDLVIDLNRQRIKEISHNIKARDMPEQRIEMSIPDEKIVTTWTSMSKEYTLDGILNDNEGFSPVKKRRGRMKKCDKKEKDEKNGKNCPGKYSLLTKEGYQISFSHSYVSMTRAIF